MSNAESRDLAARRLEKLRRILKDRHIASVAELHRELHVSPATTRRDLVQLEKLGELRRVHGGAVVSRSGLDEPLFDNKEALAAREKQRIAEAALRLIKPGISIFLDGGSTVLALSRLLHEQSNVTVVTNSLRVAMELASEGPRVMLAGGELRRLSQTFVGPLTRFMIEQTHVDIAFIGTIGITPEAGMTTTDHQEAYTKSLIASHARQVVLLADSTKVGRVSFAPFGSLADLDCLITDSGISREAAAQFRRKGIKVVTA